MHPTDHPHAHHSAPHAHGPHGQPAGGPVTAADVLRDGTRDLHDAAEHHAFQRALAKGETPLDSYVAWLGQMLLLHRALEGRVREARAASPRVALVVHDYQFQEPYLAEDLRFFGVDASKVEANPGTRAAIDAIEAVAGDPLALLGMHYVLEGSNNGSKYIAVNIRRAHGLTPGNGDRYLDPYGDAQRERWARFKADLVSCEFGEAEQRSLLAGARTMFSAISRMSDDLAAAAV